jgi:hypothetical protein
MSTVVSRRRTAKPLAIVIGVLVLLFAALPTTTLLAVGMAPTLGAFIGDRMPGRYLTKCVAGMNLAGVIPFLYKLWTTGHDMATAISLVTDLYAWFSMYSAAAMGWMLFLGFPGVVAMSRALNAKRRIYVLREQQKSLINEWGDCILPTVETAKPDNQKQGAAR